MNDIVTIQSQFLYSTQQVRNTKRQEEKVVCSEQRRRLCRSKGRLSEKTIIAAFRLSEIVGKISCGGSRTHAMPEVFKLQRRARIRIKRMESGGGIARTHAMAYDRLPFKDGEAKSVTSELCRHEIPLFACAPSLSQRGL